MSGTMPAPQPDAIVRFPEAHRPYGRALRWLYLAAPIVTAAGLAVAPLVLHEGIYSIGPVSAAHARFAGECRQCHAAGPATRAAGFRRLRAGEDQQAAIARNVDCLRCHGRTIGHSNDARAPAATHHERAPGDGLACSACHEEHDGQSLLVVDDHACIKCHSDLHAVQPDVEVADRIGTFSIAPEAPGVGLAPHPEFRLLVDKRPDPGTLRFNHRRHLMDDKLPGPDGKPARLRCQDCHRPEGGEALPFRFGIGPAATARAPARSVARGALMAPIAWSSHCGGCHRLTVTAAKGRLLGDDAVAPDEVPHTTPAAIRNYLRSQLRVASDGARPSALDEIEAALYRVDDAGCRRCHLVSEGRADEGLLPAIVATAIPSRFYPRAAFDHGKHTAAALGAPAVVGAPDCLACHGRAAESTHSSDLLVPGIAACRRCHGPTRGGLSTNTSITSSGGVAARCTSCHTYHVPPPEALGPTPLDGAAGPHAPLSSLVAAGLRETRERLRDSNPIWRLSGFSDLPTRVWHRPDIRPGTDEFRRQVFLRYGLHYADFPNDGLPLGLVRTRRTIDGEPGLTVTCEYCHTSSLFGQLVVGQPNPWANLERIWDDMAAATNSRGADAIYSKNPQGNTVVNGADHLGLLGLMMRKDDLSGDLTTMFRWTVNLAAEYKPIFDELAYIKTPPWYNYAARQSGAAGLYWDGGQPKDGNFAAYTYLITFRDLDGKDVAEALAAWKKSGPAFLSSLSAPRYPFPIQHERAIRGRSVYDDRCASCHGSYASNGPGGPGALTADSLSYPGQIYPVAAVGTDPKRSHFPSDFVERTRRQLQEEYTVTNGYVAPPLTGVWSRAPYLHNGSVPTLMELLDPPSRRPRYVLSANPDDPGDYDQARVGWRVDPLPQSAPVPADSLLRIYDPSRVPGLTNTGHVYGADLSTDERADLIEFLKCL